MLQKWLSFHFTQALQKVTEWLENQPRKSNLNALRTLSVLIDITYDEQISSYSASAIKPGEDLSSFAKHFQGKLRNVPERSETICPWRTWMGDTAPDNAQALDSSCHFRWVIHLELRGRCGALLTIYLLEWQSVCVSTPWTLPEVGNLSQEMPVHPLLAAVTAAHVGPGLAFCFPLKIPF